MTRQQIKQMMHESKAIEWFDSENMDWLEYVNVFDRFASLVVVAERAAIEQAEKQEPVAWMFVNTDGECEQIEYSKNCPIPDDPSITPLYTAPRQWQGLTKKEFLAAVDGLEDLEDCWVAIEAKLKEKNT